MKNLLPVVICPLKQGLCTLFALWTVSAQAQLEWRVSVKFILGPNDEMPCCGSGLYDSFDDVTNRIAEANAILGLSGRGYQYRLVEVVTNTEISQWFMQSRDQAHALEAAAEAAPGTYQWRTDALNVYINGWGGTAICSFPHDPSDQNDIIFIGQGSFDTSFGHEAGHYFNLLHTFSEERFLNADDSPCSQTCACAKQLPGFADVMDDTIGDNQCWTTQNAIAQGNFGVNYGAVGSDDAAVDRVYFNMMSYRADARDRFTEDQLDEMTETSNGIRFNVTNGRTRFVATTGSDTTGNGTKNFRYRTLAKGVQVAAPGDIVLLAAGYYNEPQTITKAVTLRATHGAVTIGL